MNCNYIFHIVEEKKFFLAVKFWTRSVFIGPGT